MAALLRSHDPPADIQVSAKEIKFKLFFDCLSLDDGADRFSLNIGK